MHSLELKVPPPLVALAVGFGMWAIAKLGPLVSLSDSIRLVIAIALAATGFAIAASGIVAFRRAQTTITPLNPETASSLVSTGIYGFTRNPMYLGLLTVLIGWAVYLAAPFALLGPLFFWLYIGRFQIVPEERALSALFGDRFTQYSAKVRRWL
jgi:protein-S-isoprenylcysteine O-methyltransferase Ste14